MLRRSASSKMVFFLESGVTVLSVIVDALYTRLTGIRGLSVILFSSVNRFQLLFDISNVSFLKNNLNDSCAMIFRSALDGFQPARLSVTTVGTNVSLSFDTISGTLTFTGAANTSTHSKILLLTASCFDFSRFESLEMRNFQLMIVFSDLLVSVVVNQQYTEVAFGTTAATKSATATTATNPVGQIVCYSKSCLNGGTCLSFNAIRDVLCAPLLTQGSAYGDCQPLNYHVSCRMQSQTTSTVAEASFFSSEAMSVVSLCPQVQQLPNAFFNCLCVSGYSESTCQTLNFTTSAHIRITSSTSTSTTLSMHTMPTTAITDARSTTTLTSTSNSTTTSLVGTKKLLLPRNCSGLPALMPCYPGECKGSAICYSGTCMYPDFVHDNSSCTNSANTLGVHVSGRCIQIPLILIMKTTTSFSKSRNSSIRTSTTINYSNVTKTTTITTTITYSGNKFQALPQSQSLSVFCTAYKRHNSMQYHDKAFPAGPFSDPNCANAMTCTIIVPILRYGTVSRTTASDRVYSTFATGDGINNYQSVAWTTTSTLVCNALTRCDGFSNHQTVASTQTMTRACNVPTKSDGISNHLTVAAANTSNCVCNALTTFEWFSNHLTAATMITLTPVCDVRTACDESRNHQTVAAAITSTRVCNATTTVDMISYFQTVEPTRTLTRVRNALTSCDGSSKNQTVASAIASTQIIIRNALTRCEWFSNCQTVAAANTSARVCDVLMRCEWFSNHQAMAPTFKTILFCGVLTKGNGISNYQAVTVTNTSSCACNAVTRCDGISNNQTLATATASTLVCNALMTFDVISIFPTVVLTWILTRIRNALTTCDWFSHHQTVAAANTSARVCDALMMCDWFSNYRTVAMMTASIRACDALTTCVGNSDYQTVVLTTTLNCVCNALMTSVGISNYPTVVLTTTLNCVCNAPMTSVGISNYPTVASAIASIRVCKALTTCDGISNYQTVALANTATCACNAMTRRDGLSKYQTVSMSTTSNHACDALTTCDGISKYQTVASTKTLTPVRSVIPFFDVISNHQMVAPNISTRVCNALTTCDGISNSQSLSPSMLYFFPCNSLTLCIQVSNRRFKAPPCIESSFFQSIPFEVILTASISYVYVRSSFDDVLFYAFMALLFLSTLLAMATTMKLNRVCSTFITCQGISNTRTVAPMTASTRVRSAWPTCDVILLADCDNIESYEIFSPAWTTNFICRNKVSLYEGNSNYQKESQPIKAKHFCRAVTACDGIKIDQTVVPTTTSSRVCSAFTSCDGISNDQTASLTIKSNRACSGMPTCNGSNSLLVFTGLCFLSVLIPSLDAAPIDAQTNTLTSSVFFGASLDHGKLFVYEMMTLLLLAAILVMALRPKKGSSIKVPEELQSLLRDEERPSYANKAPAGASSFSSQFGQRNPPEKCATAGLYYRSKIFGRFILDGCRRGSFGAVYDFTPDYELLSSFHANRSTFNGYISEKQITPKLKLVIKIPRRTTDPECRYLHNEIMAISAAGLLNWKTECSAMPLRVYLMSEQLLTVSPSSQSINGTKGAIIMEALETDFACFSSVLKSRGLILLTEIQFLEMLIPNLVQLHTLHRLGMVHGDLKPENILITERPLRIVLADYGMSKPTNVNLEPIRGTLGGTYLYTGLDRHQGFLTFRDDLLGLLLIYLDLIAGGHPQESSLSGSAELSQQQWIDFKKGRGLLCRDNKFGYRWPGDMGDMFAHWTRFLQTYGLQNRPDDKHLMHLANLLKPLAYEIFQLNRDQTLHPKVISDYIEYAKQHSASGTLTQILLDASALLSTYNTSAKDVRKPAVLFKCPVRTIDCCVEYFKHDQSSKTHASIGSVLLPAISTEDFSVDSAQLSKSFDAFKQHTSAANLTVITDEFNSLGNFIRGSSSPIFGFAKSLAKTFMQNDIISTQCYHFFNLASKAIKQHEELNEVDQQKGKKIINLCQTSVDWQHLEKSLTQFGFRMSDEILIVIPPLECILIAIMQVDNIPVRLNSTFTDSLVMQDTKHQMKISTLMQAFLLHTIKSIGAFMTTLLSDSLRNFATSSIYRSGLLDDALLVQKYGFVPTALTTASSLILIDDTTFNYSGNLAHNEMQTHCPIFHNLADKSTTLGLFSILLLQEPVDIFVVESVARGFMNLLGQGAPIVLIGPLLWSRIAQNYEQGSYHDLEMVFNNKMVSVLCIMHVPERHKQTEPEPDHFALFVLRRSKDGTKSTFFFGESLNNPKTYKLSGSFMHAIEHSQMQRPDKNAILQGIERADGSIRPSSRIVFPHQHLGNYCGVSSILGAFSVARYIILDRDFDDFMLQSIDPINETTMRRLLFDFHASKGLLDNRNVLNAVHYDDNSLVDDQTEIQQLSELKSHLESLRDEHFNKLGPWLQNTLMQNFNSLLPRYRLRYESTTYNLGCKMAVSGFLERRFAADQLVAVMCKTYFAQFKIDHIVTLPYETVVRLSDGLYLKETVKIPELDLSVMPRAILACVYADSHFVTLMIFPRLKRILVHDSLSGYADVKNSNMNKAILATILGLRTCCPSIMAFLGPSDDVNVEVVHWFRQMQGSNICCFVSMAVVDCICRMISNFTGMIDSELTSALNASLDSLTANETTLSANHGIQLRLYWLLRYLVRSPYTSDIDLVSILQQDFSTRTPLTIVKQHCFSAQEQKSFITNMQKRSSTKDESDHSPITLLYSSSDKSKDDDLSPISSSFLLSTHSNLKPSTQSGFGSVLDDKSKLLLNSLYDDSEMLSIYQFLFPQESIAKGCMYPTFVEHDKPSGLSPSASMVSGSTEMCMADIVDIDLEHSKGVEIQQQQASAEHQKSSKKENIVHSVLPDTIKQEDLPRMTPVKVPQSSRHNTPRELSRSSLFQSGTIASQGDISFANRNVNLSPNARSRGETLVKLLQQEEAYRKRQEIFQCPEMTASIRPSSTINPTQLSPKLDSDIFRAASRIDVKESGDKGYTASSENKAFSTPFRPAAKKVVQFSPHVDRDASSVSNDVPRQNTCDQQATLPSFTSDKQQLFGDMTVTLLDPPFPSKPVSILSNVNAKLEFPPNPNYGNSLQISSDSSSKTKREESYWSETPTKKKRISTLSLDDGHQSSIGSLGLGSPFRSNNVNFRASKVMETASLSSLRMPSPGEDCNNVDHDERSDDESEVDPETTDGEVITVVTAPVKMMVSDVGSVSAREYTSRAQQASENLTGKLRIDEVNNLNDITISADIDSVTCIHELGSRIPFLQQVMISVNEPSSLKFSLQEIRNPSWFKIKGIKNDKSLSRVEIGLLPFGLGTLRLFLLRIENVQATAHNSSFHDTIKQAMLRLEAGQFHGLFNRRGCNSPRVNSFSELRDYFAALGADETLKDCYMALTFVNIKEHFQRVENQISNLTNLATTLLRMEEGLLGDFYEDSFIVEDKTTNGSVSFDFGLKLLLRGTDLQNPNGANKSLLWLRSGVQGICDKLSSKSGLQRVGLNCLLPNQAQGMYLKCKTAPVTYSTEDGNVLIGGLKLYLPDRKFNVTNTLDEKMPNLMFSLINWALLDTESSKKLLLKDLRDLENLKDELILNLNEKMLGDARIEVSTTCASDASRLFLDLLRQPTNTFVGSVNLNEMKEHMMDILERVVKIILTSINSMISNAENSAAMDQACPKSFPDTLEADTELPFFQKLLTLSFNKDQLLDLVCIRMFITLLLDGLSGGKFTSTRIMREIYKSSVDVHDFVFLATRQDMERIIKSISQMPAQAEEDIMLKVVSTSLTYSSRKHVSADQKREEAKNKDRLKAKFELLRLIRGEKVDEALLLIIWFMQSELWWHLKANVAVNILPAFTSDHLDRLRNRKLPFSETLVSEYPSLRINNRSLTWQTDFASDLEILKLIDCLFLKREEDTHFFFPFLFCELRKAIPTAFYTKMDFMTRLQTVIKSAMSSNVKEQLSFPLVPNSDKNVRKMFDKAFTYVSWNAFGELRLQSAFIMPVLMGITALTASRSPVKGVKGAPRMNLTDLIRTERQNIPDQFQSVYWEKHAVGYGFQWTTEYIQTFRSFILDITGLDILLDTTKWNVDYARLWLLRDFNATIFRNDMQSCDGSLICGDESRGGLGEDNMKNKFKQKKAIRKEMGLDDNCLPLETLRRGKVSSLSPKKHVEIKHDLPSSLNSDNLAPLVTVKPDQRKNQKIQETAVAANASTAHSDPYADGYGLDASMNNGTPSLDIAVGAVAHVDQSFTDSLAASTDSSIYAIGVGSSEEQLELKVAKLRAKKKLADLFIGLENDTERRKLKDMLLKVGAVKHCDDTLGVYDWIAEIKTYLLQQNIYDLETQPGFSKAFANLFLAEDYLNQKRSQNKKSYLELGFTPSIMQSAFYYQFSRLRDGRTSGKTQAENVVPLLDSKRHNDQAGIDASAPTSGFDVESKKKEKGEVHTLNLDSFDAGIETSRLHSTPLPSKKPTDPHSTCGLAGKLSLADDVTGALNDETVPLVSTPNGDITQHTSLRDDQNLMRTLISRIDSLAADLSRSERDIKIITKCLSDTTKSDAAVGNNDYRRRFDRIESSTNAIKVTDASSSLHISDDSPGRNPFNAHLDYSNRVMTAQIQVGGFTLHLESKGGVEDNSGTSVTVGNESSTNETIAEKQGKRTKVTHQGQAFSISDIARLIFSEISCFIPSDHLLSGGREILMPSSKLQRCYAFSNLLTLLPDDQMQVFIIVAYLLQSRWGHVFEVKFDNGFNIHINMSRKS